MKMKLTLAASAAALLTSAFMMTAPAANAEDYCITNGAQAAHGCGYPTMEACRAASAGIGGMCSAAASPQIPGNALAYQPRQTHARSGRHVRNQSVNH